MIIIIRTPNEEFTKKLQEMHPGVEFTTVYDVTEIEVYWWQRDWWQFQWWRFNMWFCELMVPELKEDRTITFE